MGKTKAASRAKRGSTAGEVDGVPDHSPAGLIALLSRPRTPQESLAALRRSGIITKAGKLSPRYKNWGRKVSRTPTADQM